MGLNNYKIVKDDIRYFKNLIGDNESVTKNAIEKIGLEKFKKYLLGVAKSHWSLGDGKKDEFPKEQYKELIAKLLNKEDIDLMEETGTMSAGSYEGNALFSEPIKKKIKKSIDEGMFKPRDTNRLEKWNQRQPEKEVNGETIKINQFNDVGKKDGYWEEFSGVDDFVSKGFYKNDKMIGVWEQFEDGVNVYNEIYDDNGEYIRAEYFNDNKDEEVDEYTNIISHKLTSTLSLGHGIRIRKGTNVHWYPKEECFVVVGGDYPGMIIDLNPEEFYHMGEKVINEQTDSASTGSYETPAFLAPSYRKMRLGQKTTYGGKGGKFVKVKDKCKKFPYCSQGAIDQPLEMTNTYNGESVELTPTYPKKYNPLKLVKEDVIIKNIIKNIIFELSGNKN